jgi:hypothetical protein
MEATEESKLIAPNAFYRDEAACLLCSDVGSRDEVWEWKRSYSTPQRRTAKSRFDASKARTHGLCLRLYLHPDHHDSSHQVVRGFSVQ